MKKNSKHCYDITAYSRIYQVNYWWTSSIEVVINWILTKECRKFYFLFSFYLKFIFKIYRFDVFSFYCDIYVILFHFISFYHISLNASLATIFFLFLLYMKSVKMIIILSQLSFTDLNFCCLLDIYLYIIILHYLFVIHYIIYSLFIHIIHLFIVSDNK